MCNNFDSFNKLDNKTPRLLNFSLLNINITEFIKLNICDKWFSSIEQFSNCFISFIDFINVRNVLSKESRTLDSMSDLKQSRLEPKQDNIIEPDTGKLIKSES